MIQTEERAFIDAMRNIGPHLRAEGAYVVQQDGEALRRTLRALPGFLASFEREPAAGDGGLLEPMERPAPEWRPEDSRVRFRIAGQEYDATGFGPVQVQTVATDPVALASVFLERLDLKALRPVLP